MKTRASLIHLFGEARKLGYLREGRETEAAKMTELKVRKSQLRDGGKIITFTPEELDAMMSKASEEYLPWVALQAYAGIRGYPIGSACGVRLEKERIKEELHHLSLRSGWRRTNRYAIEAGNSEATIHKYYRDTTRRKKKQKLGSK